MGKGEINPSHPGNNIHRTTDPLSVYVCVYIRVRAGRKDGEGLKGGEGGERGRMGKGGIGLYSRECFDYGII